MLLFGKSRFAVSLAAFAHELGRMVSGTAVPRLDEAREWLAFCGQMEQAALDAGAEGKPYAEVTDAAAALLLDLAGGLPPNDAQSKLQAKLAPLAAFPAAGLATFRVPEGFAWYALYPESYAQTAAAWAAEEQTRSRTRVLVIGLRSIGTALGAIVAEALRRRGRAVLRLSPRPMGHPFAREVSLGDAEITGDAALIVDEGPGLSGSSMAAAAEALAKRGVAAERIFFLPGHGNGPGNTGGAQARRWWTPERVRVTPLGETRVSGCSLHQRLAKAAEAALGEEIAAVEETGFPATSELPRGVLPAFASPEIACRGRSGERIVWRFGGFAAVDASLLSRAERGEARQKRMAEMGLALKPAGRVEGWIGLRMPRAAVPLRPSSLDMTDRLALHIAAASVKPLDAGLAADGAKRIEAALTIWAEESGGSLSSGLAEDAIAEAPLHLLAGDGRLAPCEWVALADAEALKIDATGGDCGHGWAGAQSILWDVAGAIVEWDFDDAQSERFTSAVTRHAAIAIPNGSLAFYTAGYDCLRLAMARHCAALYPQGSPAQASLAQHAAHYERRLRAALQLAEVAR